MSFSSVTVYLQLRGSESTLCARRNGARSLSRMSDVLRASDAVSGSRDRCCESTGRTDTGTNMQIDPSCTFASQSVSAKNRHVIETIRDALCGAYPWPVFVRARDPRAALGLLHAAANYVQGELSGTVRIARTTLLQHAVPAPRRAGGLAGEYEWLAKNDVLLVDGIDESPLNAETIITLARAMVIMHATRRPVVTFAALSNDSVDGLLAQLSTRFAGGRPLHWQSTPPVKARRAA